MVLNIFESDRFMVSYELDKIYKKKKRKEGKLWWSKKGRNGNDAYVWDGAV